MNLAGFTQENSEFVLERLTKECTGPSIKKELLFRELLNQTLSITRNVCSMSKTQRSYEIMLVLQTPRHRLLIDRIVADDRHQSAIVFLFCCLFHWLRSFPPVVVCLRSFWTRQE